MAAGLKRASDAARSKKAPESVAPPTPHGGLRPDFQVGLLRSLRFRWLGAKSILHLRGDL
ncbi:hypothetical protein DYH09_12160 [bacterium CPR1]|nr:hypothetical protein [bacterium CPR1]